MPEASTIVAERILADRGTRSAIAVNLHRFASSAIRSTSRSLGRCDFTASRARCRSRWGIIVVWSAIVRGIGAISATIGKRVVSLKDSHILVDQIELSRSGLPSRHPCKCRE